MVGWGERGAEVWWWREPRMRPSMLCMERLLSGAQRSGAGQEHGRATGQRQLRKLCKIWA